MCLRINMRIILSTLMFMGVLDHNIAQPTITAGGEDWAERTYNSMSLDEKVGQLFMIRAHSDKGRTHENQVKKYVKDYHVGGLCFFQGTPTKQARLTNEFQRASKVPLMIGVDAEWGLGMRFKKKAFSFPRQLQLGAIQDYNLIYEMGLKVAEHAKRIGIHVNFAPVVDVNNNIDNPVINDRSFGEDVYNVATKAYAYMKGMQDGGIMACAKHFPGHGDTDVDSHADLPIIPYNKKRLDSIELMPFRVLAREGVESMMVAHLSIPAIEDRPNRPSTLSKKLIDGIIREEMHFNGLIFTDAMEMQGVVKYFKNGEAELEAFKAGNDIILLPNDLPQAFRRIKKAVENNEISAHRLKSSVLRILKAKKEYGLDKPQTVNNEGSISEDINDLASQTLKSELVEQSLTIARNESLQIPIRELASKNYISIAIGSKSKTTFQSRLESYVDCRHYNLSKTFSESEKSKVYEAASAADVIFISLHDMSKYSSKNFGLTQEAIKMVNDIAFSKNVILTVFGSPYSLKYFDSVEHVLMSYAEDEMTQDLSAQGLFGAFDFSGKLPVTASEVYQSGMGNYQPSLGRLGYAKPERVGLSTEGLSAIDTIVQEMIKGKSAPGCQILIAKDNKIVFEKAYGHHTYDNKRSTSMKDVFDLASVTKILSTTISVMKLHEERKLSIYQPIDKYVTEADTSNKGDMIIEDIMAHHAGLPGWIPFYENTIEKEKKKIIKPPKYYSKAKSEEYALKVTDDMFLRTDFQDSIWSRLLGCKIRDHRNYEYSDLGFYMLHHAIERLTNQQQEDYVENTFYNPLGLRTTGYNPWQQFSRNRTPPTEKDKYFRDGIVQGYVHDMGAAMMDGVSGHAGLFSNAQDLAIILQMLLNGGSYGGKQYLSPNTIKTFTSRFYRSTRRGIGFDLKELNSDKRQNMSEKASDSTYGHLGFTGTCVFADPEHDIIFIFLSNRTYPSMNNNKFGKKNFRPRVQTVIYDSLITKNKA